MTYALDYIAPASGPVLGLSVAVQDLTRAWLRNSTQRPIVARAHGKVSGEAFLAMAQVEGLNIGTDCVVLDAQDPAQSLAPLRAVLIPDPALAPVASLRSLLPPAARPAICGLVHTLSGDQVSRAFWDNLLAPLTSADALICPSASLRDSVHKLWDVQAERLADRLGVKPTCPVQTPVLPLGVDSAKFTHLTTQDKRAAQREALGIAEDEIVVLFVGRLNFATKAHPLPLLQSLSKAARQSHKKIRLVLYGYYYPQADMQPRFERLIAQYAKNIVCTTITNDDPRFPDGLWAAADIFTSLVENVQESFGLTPIEAMACGLPCVISDWDGYREGVRHGVDGFLVPTVAPPAFAGDAIASAFAHTGHYGTYLMGASQSTAIDVEAAASAFALLASDPTLRKEMGQRGQSRVQEIFDWRVLIPRYEALLSQLAENRASLASIKQQQTTPFHVNPFDVFATFPSASLAKDDVIQPTGSLTDLAELARHDMNLFVPDLLLPLPLIEQLYAGLLAQGALPVGSLLTLAPESEKDRMIRTIGWFLKHGLCVRQAS